MNTGHYEISTEHAATGIVRRIRDIPPLHYTFEIESFSFLLDSKVDAIDSEKFEVGDYKWKLSLYPSGNRKGNGNGYVSLDLAMVETNDLPLNWELNVEFRFFVFDQIRDKFLTIQFGDNEKVKRFHRMKTKWGIDQVISLDIFNDSGYGYLVDDHCIFGVEILIIKGTGKGEIHSMQKLTPGSTSYKFRIENYSTRGQSPLESKIFTIGDQKWYIPYPKLMLYPIGDSRAKEALSLYLYSKNDSTAETLSKSKVVAKYKLRLLDQRNGNHLEKTTDLNRFESDSSGWGYINFCALNDVKDQSKGYLVDNTLLIEIDFIFISVVKLI
ncbi:hypothetical protein ACFE04_028543 [Oxalis oulophora]